jgi:hypothetical protein
MPTIGADVSKELKDAFKQFAASRTLSESRLAAAWIAERLRQELGLPAPPPDVAARDDDGPKTEQVFVRLSPYHYAKLGQDAAERNWKRGTFLAQMYLAYCDRRAVLCDKEIAALRQVARQLADLGRNVNQIARKLNSSLDEAHHAQSLQVDLLYVAVDLATTTVKDLIAANLRGWGVNDEKG